MMPPEMLSLWNLLVQSWGQKFAEQYGIRPNDAWQGMLAHVSTDAAMHAFKRALRESPTFPPTLGDFLAWSQDYRPPAAKALQSDSHCGYQQTTEELRRNASSDVSAFATYRDYERWRDAHAVKGKRPAHPEPSSPDWLYLNRLAWADAAANNRRTSAEVTGHGA